MRQFLFFIFICWSNTSAAQAAFSLATDASVLRNFSDGQKFWAFGQSVTANFHFSPQWTGYAAVCYYTPGKFRNSLTASARDTAMPAQLQYVAHSTVRYRQFSFGIKKYVHGAYNNEETWNLYGVAGFGLLLGRAENVFSVVVDTAKYAVPQQSVEGTGDFKRLTFDLGLGFEFLLGASVYVYTDLRTWIPASDFPSPYLYNNNTPRNLMVNGGIRVLFE